MAMAALMRTSDSRDALKRIFAGDHDKISVQKSLWEDLVRILLHLWSAWYMFYFQMLAKEEISEVQAKPRLQGHGFLEAAPLFSQMPVRKKFVETQMKSWLEKAWKSRSCAFILLFLLNACERSICGGLIKNLLRRTWISRSSAFVFSRFYERRVFGDPSKFLVERTLICRSSAFVLLFFNACKRRDCKVSSEVLVRRT